MDAHATCCSSQADRDSIDAARFGLPDPKELVDDPVLAGCCAEDLQILRRGEALKNALLDVDRSTVRLKLQAQVLPPIPPEPPQQAPSESSLDSDGEGDGALVELRRRRLAELQRQAAERRQAAVQGYGSLNDLPAASLMERVEQLDGPAVVHVALSGCEAGAQLDEHLACLAHRQRGTFFARVAVRRGDALAAALRLQGLPGLVCFRAGAVVGRAPVSQFGPPGGLVEEEVTSYLRRLRVLREEPAGGGEAGGGGRGAAAGSDAEDEEEEEWKLKPCEVCGRRYPHEHVRAVYGAVNRKSGSGASTDSED